MCIRDRWNDLWLLSEVFHEGKQPQVLEENVTSDTSASTDDFQQGYRNRFLATPWEVFFRPPLEHPKPVSYTHLPGEREIRDAAEMLRKANLRHTEVLPLYARLTPAEQQKIFQPRPGRKIVLSTNVAETSLTVPGIRYVIDSGTARISRYSYRAKVQRLPIEAVSQASANQRKEMCIRDRGLAEIDGAWAGQHGGDRRADQGAAEHAVGDAFLELGGGRVGGVQMHRVAVAGDCGEQLQLSLIHILLKRNADKRDTAMIYVSDHGESLGENGVYLHAAPYSIAPQAQIHVPMVMWFAPQALGNWGIQRSCLDGKRDDKDLSHDNLFHSVLGLLDVQTSLYQPALDIFASCRAPRAAQ